jgi:hypothetical protein
LVPEAVVVAAVAELDAVLHPTVTCVVLVEAWEVHLPGAVVAATTAAMAAATLAETVVATAAVMAEVGAAATAEAWEVAMATPVVLLGHPLGGKRPYQHPPDSVDDQHFLSVNFLSTNPCRNEPCAKRA